MAFDCPRQVFAGIDPGRFARLDAFCRSALAKLPLAADARHLRLDLDDCLAAVDNQRAFAASAESSFAPFEGCWLGGDLHDASRVYRHIWYPTEVDGDFATQRVLMLDSDNRATQAYDFCQLGPEPVITGLVGERAHRGYALPENALLWLGEERDEQISVHLERVWPDGQLYDIRGVVVAPGDGDTEIRARSDWRYHRVDDGAVRDPRQET